MHKKKWIKKKKKNKKKNVGLSFTAVFSGKLRDKSHEQSLRHSFLLCWYIDPLFLSLSLTLSLSLSLCIFCFTILT